MPGYIQHVTKIGERWDLLAWDYYGDPTNYGPIIAANPTVPIEAAFEAGLMIAVPILEQDQAQTYDAPPWMTS